MSQASEPNLPKVVLITGASSGFGHRTAQKLLQKGFIVYPAARRVEKMQDLADDGAHVLQMDVTQDEEVKNGIARVIAEQGRIDVLINNAGYGAYGAIEETPIGEVQYQFDVNVFGYGRLIQAVLPHMRDKRDGRIINVASLVSHLSTPIIGWYAATKHAVDAMSDALRMEVKSLGIDVVLIEPGAVKTGFEDVAFAKLDAAPHADDYRGFVEGFRNYASRMYKRSPGPDGTAEAIVRATTARRPRVRYRTTRDSKLLAPLSSLMPDWISDWITIRQLSDR